MAERKSRARRVLLVCGTALAMLVVLEIGVRLVAHWQHRERGLVLDSQLGWRPAASLEKRGAWWGATQPARTNALGFRDPERTLAKPTGVRRIVLLGDSFVFGVGVDDGQRVSEALEHEVGGEVWNLGVTAYGPDQELLLLESDVARCTPDVVVWFATLANDLEDLRHDVRYSWPKPWFDLRGEELIHHAPEPGLLVRLRNASYLFELALAPLDQRTFNQRVAEPWRERDALPLFGAIAARMERSARTLGAAFVAVVIPSEAANTNRFASDASVLHELEQRGIAALDLRPPFADALAKHARVMLPDGHWNAAGHALAAQCVAAELRRLGIVR